MLMVHSAMAAMTGAGASGGKTYNEFVAHITALAADPSEGAVIAWDGNIPAAAVVIQAGPSDVGDMNGSSWGPLAGGWFNSVTNTACRIVQHALPSEAEFGAQKSASRRLFVRASSLSPNTFPAVTRNGYTSLSRGSGGRLNMPELIYWDGTRAQRMQPSLGLGPTPYDWTV